MPALTSTVKSVRSRVKICGLTRLEDVQACVDAGADALGFVFYPASPRFVTAEKTAQLLHSIPAFIQSVGLFVNATLADVLAVLAVAPIDLLQFHGDESPELCQHIGLNTHKRWIKALAVKPDNLDALSLDIALFQQAGASAILLDTWHPDLKGGTGAVFDWSIVSTLKARHDIPFILAGGLTLENVASAVSFVRPFAVDVSGGVELIDSQTHMPLKGQKDVLKIQQFIAGATHG